MGVKTLLVHFAIVFALTLVVSAAVSLLWNLVRYGSVVADWESSFHLAVVFGIVLTGIGAIGSKGKTGT